jgi:hypothetical protein
MPLFPLLPRRTKLKRNEKKQKMQTIAGKRGGQIFFGPSVTSLTSSRPSKSSKKNAVRGSLSAVQTL